MASDKVLSLEGAELLYNDIRARLVGIEQGGGNTGGGGTGTDGVGILSVVQTTTSTADKGENVVTVTLTDGRSSKFSVLNGSRGASGSPGTNGVDGKGIDSITVSETPADGGANRVTINMTDGTSKSFSVLNGRTGSAGPQGEPGKDATIDSSIISYAEDSTGNDAITDVAAVNGKLVFNRGKAFAPISHLTMETNPHKTTAADVGAVPLTRTVNGKALSSNISLTYSDVGAAPSSHTHTQYALKHKHSVSYSEYDDSYYQMPSMQVGELMVFNYEDPEYSREIKAPSGGTYIVSGQGLFATGKTVSGGTVFGSMPLHGVILKIS